MVMSWFEKMTVDISVDNLDLGMSVNVQKTV